MELLIVRDSRVAESIAEGEGGGIFMTLNDGDTAFINVEVVDNSASVAGGISITASDAVARFHVLDVSRNRATMRGGGMFVRTNEGIVRVTGSVVSHNSTQEDGGGILSEILLGGQLEILASEVSENQTSGVAGDGAGVNVLELWG